jgi:hypothetical protein
MQTHPAPPHCREFCFPDVGALIQAETAATAAIIRASRSAMVRLIAETVHFWLARMTVLLLHSPG